MRIHISSSIVSVAYQVWAGLWQSRMPKGICIEPVGVKRVDWSKTGQSKAADLRITKHLLLSLTVTLSLIKQICTFDLFPEY